eukprot:scaffold236562_cov32-Prasinocladus_malaysianus.AAC.1
MDAITNACLGRLLSCAALLEAAWRLYLPWLCRSCGSSEASHCCTTCSPFGSDGVDSDAPQPYWCRFYTSMDGWMDGWDPYKKGTYKGGIGTSAIKPDDPRLRHISPVVHKQ